MSIVRFMIDVSALARYPVPAVAKRLDELSAAGQTVTTNLMELELLGAVRDAEIYAKVAKLRQASVETLEMLEADIQRAREVQALLVERGEFGVAWTALVVAAVAERHGVVVLHCNAVFERIAEITGQGVEGMAEGPGRTSAAPVVNVPVE